MLPIPTAILLVTVLLTAPAWAQSLGGLATGSGAPLEIFADQGIEWLRSEQKYVARGNALARQGDTQVAADVLTAFYRDSEDQPETGSPTQGGGDIYRILAEGNVVITSPNQTAYADRGVYFVDDQIAVLQGNDLRLETENEVVTARDSLEYWENFQGTPIAVARGDASVLTDGRQIEADELVATLRPNEEGRNEIAQIDAFGDVEISSPEEYARGDQGVYYVKEERAILAGSVRITQGETQLNGQRAEVDLATGVSRLLPTAGGRVEGILMPRENGGPSLPPQPGNGDGTSEASPSEREDGAQ
ncbi:LptA/OstA family protein [Algihabitans albus]|uniref:LptA/OstA family protein n=1 Tax=Algihabitans albus TaxID=2164067 RepID=UPI000E5C711B|nr:LptA/OstA family protein [Algihabitans albus]